MQPRAASILAYLKDQPNTCIIVKFRLGLCTIADQEQAIKSTCNSNRSVNRNFGLKRRIPSTKRCPTKIESRLS
jgi:hypothetical protein